MAEEVMILGVVGLGVAGVIATAGSIATNWRRSKEVAYAARLKQLMIERGFNADEIERIVRAEPPTSDDRDWDRLKDFAQARR